MTVDDPAPPGDDWDASLPRWVKAFLLVLALVVVLAVATVLVGGHGPGAHVP